MNLPETLLIAGSFLLFISILTTKLSTRLGIPSLIIFLLIGMIAGHKQLGNVDFRNPVAAQLLGAVTLCLILFTGGMETDYKHIRPIVWNGVLLATVGILITTCSIGFFIWGLTTFLLGGNIQFTLLEGLLMGSIVASTDAAAVFSILRSKNMHLKANLSPLLELESGSNDTMAWFLMTLFINLLTMKEKMSPLAALSSFIKDMVVGGVVGLLVGKLMRLLLNHLRLSNRSLYPGLILAVVILTYSLTHSLLHGNAFLAVYIVGLILGNQDSHHKKSIIQFCDGISWLMQIIMFIMLGLLVHPHKLLPITGIGLLLSIFLMFIARPLSVFISLFFSKTLNFNHKVFISWVGLRGAVPIVFATYPLLAGIHKSDLMYHIVFFIVLTSILLQGTTLSPLAKWLQLEEAVIPQHAPSIQLAKEVDSELTEITIPPHSSVIGKKLVQIKLPENSLIVFIKRNDTFVIPRGDTVIHALDLLMIVVENRQVIDAIKTHLGVVAE